jgi:uncharacterized damage-inducible protein DinB
MSQNMLIKRELEQDEELPVPVRQFWAEFQKARNDTKHGISGLTPAELLWKPHSKSNSVGMLLLHIAAVELDFMVRDIARQEVDPRLSADLLMEEVGAGPTLPDPGEQALEWFVDKLDRSRDITRRVLLTLSDADLAGWRGADRPGFHYELQVSWILAHLIQHEAAHRGQIQMLNSLRRAMSD